MKTIYWSTWLLLQYFICALVVGRGVVFVVSAMRRYGDTDAAAQHEALVAVLDGKVSLLVLPPLAAFTAALLAFAPACSPGFLGRALSPEPDREFIRTFSDQAIAVLGICLRVFVPLLIVVLAISFLSSLAVCQYHIFSGLEPEEASSRGLEYASAIHTCLTFFNTLRRIPLDCIFLHGWPTALLSWLALIILCVPAQQMRWFPPR